jgi:uncharacterized protein (UPF0332 family)
MAAYELHLELAETLHRDMQDALRSNEWPIAVDAGYYAVFHAMEAMNALECRDSYTFADAADILENVLTRRGLVGQFLDDYRYLFYFRRGALYGAHIPSPDQLSEFAKRANRGFKSVQRLLARHTRQSSSLRKKVGAS